jgi:YVTN family beta-propeller protein
MRRLTDVAAALAVVVPLAGCGRPRDTIFEGYAFVAVADPPAVTVVDLASFTVKQRIPLSSPPFTMVSHPQRRALYLLSGAGVTRVDTAGPRAAQAAWAGDKPRRLRLGADGGRLYVLDSASIQTLHPDTLEIQQRLRLPASPVDFDLSPDGRWACISLVSGEAVVVDLEPGKVTATVPLGGEPGPVAVRYDGRQAFVANRADRTVAAIDLAAGRLITRLALNARPEAMRFKPDGGELFVSGGDTGVVLIISAYRDEVDQPLLAGSEPRDMAISADNRMLYVANSGANTVSVIDIDRRRTLTAVPVGDEPHRVALTPDHQYALVLNRGSGDMAVIRRRIVEGRESIRPLFTMIPVGSRPEDLAVQAR